MRLIIAGNRTFTDYRAFCPHVDRFVSALSEKPTIVSGCATGVDSLAIRYAQEHGLQLVRVPADWARHGRAAGPIRNRQMAGQADALLAFWDGKSAGTRSMITIARELGLRVTVISEVFQ